MRRLLLTMDDGFGGMTTVAVEYVNQFRVFDSPGHTTHADGWWRAVDIAGDYMVAESPSLDGLFTRLMMGT